MLTHTKHGYLAKEYCNLSLPLKVCKSNAGYYIGTYDDEGPVSRESVEYYDTFEQCDYALKNDTFTQRHTP